jgi:signal recognition particle subunit SRP54
MAKMPGFGQMADQVDERELKKVEAMISSMTRQERAQPDLIDKSRSSRIARGCGRSPKDVSDLLKRFAQMREMMAGLGAPGGLLSKIPGMGQLAGAGGLDPAALLAGGPAGFKAPVVRRGSAAAKKKKRKQSKQSRRKGRRR